MICFQLEGDEAFNEWSRKLGQERAAKEGKPLIHSREDRALKAGQIKDREPRVCRQAELIAAPFSLEPLNWPELTKAPGL